MTLSVTCVLGWLGGWCRSVPISVRSIDLGGHGSAPDIAGRNIANPLALLMSSVMMLNFLAETRQLPELAETAELIRRSYDACLIHGEKTRDLGGELGTAEFADAVIARL